MAEGAVDNDYDDAERSAREQLLADQPPVTEIMVDGVAFDLVKRQPLYVRRCVADDLVEYYEEEGFDLLNYNQHPYLPVTIDDPVFECVFIGNAEGLHNCNQTYDYSAGRLAVVPVHEAWTDEGGDGS